MIIFKNEGAIDIQGAVVMGINVKDSKSAIGYFGTGLKFAIATVLRKGGAVQIFSDGKKYQFGTEPLMMRGEEFKRVTMNGQPLGFTTELGRNWESWMAFRELASNALDEAGSYHYSDEPFLSDPDTKGQTIIAVEGIDKVWMRRETIILESLPIHRNRWIEVHEGRSSFIYYKGIRVGTPPLPTSVTYNIVSDDLPITEDRTAEWFQAETRVEKGLGAMDDDDLLRSILTCGQNYAEHKMNVPLYGTPQATFRRVSRELAMGASQELNANPMAVEYARKSAIKDMKPGEHFTLTSVQRHMLDQATKYLVAGGYDVTQFPTVIVDTLGPAIHGMAKGGKIFISRLAFQKGTRELAATLLEEYAHLKSGCSDRTEGFQNWLFDQLLIQIEDKNGKPF